MKKFEFRAQVCKFMNDIINDPMNLVGNSPAKNLLDDLIQEFIDDGKHILYVPQFIEKKFIFSEAYYRLDLDTVIGSECPLSLWDVMCSLIPVSGLTDQVAETLISDTQYYDRSESMLRNEWRDTLNHFWSVLDRFNRITRRDKKGKVSVFQVPEPSNLMSAILIANTVKALLYLNSRLSSFSSVHNQVVSDLVSEDSYAILHWFVEILSLRRNSLVMVSGWSPDSGHSYVEVF